MDNGTIVLAALTATIVLCGVGIVAVYIRLTQLLSLDGRRQRASAGVDKAVAQVFDDEYRDKLRTASTEKLQRIVDRDAAKLEDELAHDTEAMGEYIRTEVAKQMQQALATLRQNVETAQVFLVETATNNGAIVEAKSQDMVDHIVAATNRSEHLITTTTDEIASRIVASATSSEKMIAATAAESAKLINEQAVAVSKDFESQIDAYKTHITTAFEQNMTQVIAYYVRQAMAERLELDDQLSFIIAELETHKAAMIEDIKR